MTSKAAWEGLKTQLEGSGEILVGGDVVPYGQPHILVVGSDKKNLDIMAMSAQIKDLVGLPNTPLPKGQDNFYPFIVLLYQGEPNIYNGSTGKWEHAPVTVDSIEAWVDGADAAFIMAEPLTEIDPELLEDLQELAAAQIKPSTDPDNPIILAHTTPLDPNAWINLRVHFSSIIPLTTDSVKQLLSEGGYKVIAPDRGVPGLVVSTPSVQGVDSTSVFFNPNGHLVTGDMLQVEVFDKLGYTGAIPNASVGIYTSQSTQASQQLLDVIYRAQEVGGTSMDALDALLEILGQMLKALPVLVWIALSGVAAFVGWNIYKYIREERKRPSLLRRKARRRYEEY